MQQAERVGFVDVESVALRLDVELVQRSSGHAGQKAFPDAGRAAGAQKIRLGSPLIEAADDRDGACVGCPHAEDGAGLAIVGDEMGSHLFVHAVIAALVEEVEVLVGEKLRGGDGGLGTHALGRNACALVYRRRAPLRRDLWEATKGEGAYHRISLQHRKPLNGHYTQTNSQTVSVECRDG